MSFLIKLLSKILLFWENVFYQKWTPQATLTYQKKIDKFTLKNNAFLNFVVK